MTTGLAIPPVIPVGEIAKDTLKGTQTFLVSMSQSEQSGDRWLKRVNNASKEAWNEMNKDGWKKT